MNFGKSRVILFIQKYWPVLVCFLFSIVFLLPVFLQKEILFKYDWSWPVFDLKQFWVGLTDTSIQGIFSAVSKTGPAIFGLFGLIHFPPEVFFKLFIFTVHFCASYGFYKLIKPWVKNEAVAVISGLAYAFTPYIFIRTIVGFTWSMVAYAALPFFLAKYWQTKKSALDYLILGFLLSLIFSQTQAGILTCLIITVDLIVIASHRVLARRGNLSTVFRTGSSMIDCRASSPLSSKSWMARNDSVGLLASAKNYFLAFVSLLIFALPWLIVMLAKKQTLTTVSGGAVTTLNFIASLPHSFRNMLMLSDHHITAGYFYPLSHDRYYLFGWLFVWLVALCAVFNKKNRAITFTFIISSLLVLPFIKGPTGIFGHFYIWFYNHVPQIAIFREIYHFEFLYAISLCVLFAIGLDWIWGKIDECRVAIKKFQFLNNQKSKKLTSLFTPSYVEGLLTSLKAALAASVIVIVWPYFTFDYAGYLKLQQIPQEYTDLYNYFEANKDVCKKIYYPPGLGFVYFNGDDSPGASNSDVLAVSLGVPYLTDGASVLNLPSAEMFYRNELISQFYEKNDSGQFAGLLNEGSIDCVVVRTDLRTKYKDTSNLGKETDPAIVSKWENDDILGLVGSKEGLNLEKRFGNNIYIFKSEIPASPAGGRNPKSHSSLSDEDGRSTSESMTETNSNFQNTKMEETGKSAIQQFLGTRNSELVTLPLTDWAINFVYYKDGWSRGRYDFWRKLLFAETRQDFIYTDKPSAVLNGKVEQDGNYELWVRYLTGGEAGSWELGVGSSKFEIQKDIGTEKFVWKKLGEVNVQKDDTIKIENVAGENAIADLVLVQAN